MLHPIAERWEQISYSFVTRPLQLPWQVSQPAVSVVVPTRNRRALLERTLSTVLRQQRVDVEVIVVDEASEDDTPGWLARVDDPRVLVVRHAAPHGVARARNAGLARASAPWVAFVDDDDLWAPTRLATQLDALAARAGSAWAFGGAVIADAELRIRAAQRVVASERFLPLLLGHNVVPGGASGVLAATAAVREMGGFDGELRIMADWDLWIRLALESAPATVDRPLVAYVLHGANMTAEPGGFRRELERIRDKHRGPRAALGVELNDVTWGEWLAEVQRRGGLRLAPAMIQARIAMAQRSPRAGARAVAIALWPGWLQRRDAWRIARIPVAWREEAEAWLAPIRARERAVAHRQLESS
jgi:glycosyltransferase involved in cell wall biosynthesis